MSKYGCVQQLCKSAQNRKGVELRISIVYLRLLYMYVCLLVQFSRVALTISMYSSNKESDGQGGDGGGGTGPDEQSFSSIRNSELFPHREKVVGKNVRWDFVCWKWQIFRASS